MKKIIIFIFALSIFFSFSPVFAQDKIDIYFFYSSTCPHCAAEEVFLDVLESKYPQIKIERYEVISSQQNQALLASFYENRNIPQNEMGWIPVTFTSQKYFLGFNDQIALEIENCLQDCINGTTTDKSQTEITIPFLGKVDISKLSLPVITIVLAALDGFNPCAMWVLLFLITLLTNMRSRKRMWLIGGTFVFASGFVYFLILSAWLNIFLAISYVNLTRIIIGTFALIVGILQIRNFMNFRAGVCKISDGKTSIQEKIKNGLKTHTEKIASAPLTIAVLAGAIVLALGVNLVEFFCSAGLPTIYTRILSMNNLSSLTYYLYLAFYTFIFMLDDIIIFMGAVFVLDRFNFSEKYNYWTTLIGGIIIFALGVLLILRPEILMFK